MSAPFRPPPLPVLLDRPPRGRVLVVAPHPDDESVGPGGTVRHHVLQKDPVRVIVVSSGIQGDPDGRFDRSEYVRIREREAKAAMAVLGIDDIRFWGYVDNLSDADYDIFEGLPSDPDDKRRALTHGLGDRLLEAIEAFHADIVYYPWTGEINPDHWACGVAIEGARRRAAQRLAGVSFLGYETWSATMPDTVIDTSSVHDAKLSAIRCYESQLAYTDLVTVITGLNPYRGSLLKKGARFGEAFTGRYDARLT
jgi:LmbE family N-acetylglucosaminyl deacetylase